MFKVILVLLGCLLILGACEENTDLNKQRKKQTAMQVTNQEKAEQLYPMPQIDDYITRRQVIRWTDEMDNPSVWYVYVYLRGVPEPLGFYIADAPPTPYCAFLNPPDQVIDRYEGDVVVTAPGIDGVYYGEGNCNDLNYFWDEASGAMVQLKGFDLFAVNAPLDLEVPQFTIVSKEN